MTGRGNHDGRNVKNKKDRLAGGQGSTPKAPSFTAMITHRLPFGQARNDRAEPNGYSC